MKIFATRKKKKSVGPRTVHKSDPIVEELLKKDSSEWNAKEKRMVKRYRDRKAKEAGDDDDDDDDEGIADTSSIIVEEGKEKKENNDDDDDNISGDDGSDDDSDSDNSDRDDDDKDDSDSSSDDDESEVSKEEKKSETEKVEPKNNDITKELPKKHDPPTLEKQETSTDVSKEKVDDDDKKDNDNDNDEMINKDHAIWGLLDKLNSKQKRTYSRQLKRLGRSVLDEVEKEVNKILDEMIIAENLKRDQTEAASTDNKDVPSTSENQTENLEQQKKKRKKDIEWNKLTVEERFRREEQRKKQQEAAERRARGEAIAPGHKRPLNSERRRANRRKPKWVSKPSSQDIEKFDHNSSGFSHRKLVKQDQQQATGNY
jgi:hypothetical protein